MSFVDASVLLRSTRSMLGALFCGMMIVVLSVVTVLSDAPVSLLNVTLTVLLITVLLLTLRVNTVMFTKIDVPLVKLPSTNVLLVPESGLGSAPIKIT